MAMFRVRGFKRLFVEIVSDGLSFGVIGLVLMTALALPAFDATATGHFNKAEDISVIFLDRYGQEVGRRGIRTDDSVTPRQAAGLPYQGDARDRGPALLRPFRHRRGRHPARAVSTTPPATMAPRAAPRSPSSSRRTSSSPPNARSSARSRKRSSRSGSRATTARTRSSSSTSTAPTWAAALSGSPRRPSSTSARRSPTSASPRQRCSPACSRHRPSTRRTSISPLRASAPTSCSATSSTPAFSPRARSRQRGATRRRRSIARRGELAQLLPRLRLRGDQEARRGRGSHVQQLRGPHHHRPGAADLRRGRDHLDDPRPGRAVPRLRRRHGRDRAQRADPRHGRRRRLRQEPVQPRHRLEPPAGLVVQALRLRHLVRDDPDQTPADPNRRPARLHRRLVPGKLRPQLQGPHHARDPPSPSRSTPCRCRCRSRWAASRSPTRRTAWASPTISRSPARLRSASRRSSRHRHGLGLFGLRQRRLQDTGLRHHQGHHADAASCCSRSIPTRRASASCPKHTVAKMDQMMYAVVTAAPARAPRSRAFPSSARPAPPTPIATRGSVASPATTSRRSGSATTTTARPTT